MDTKRYGGPGGEVNVDVDRPEKNAIPLVEALYKLLATRWHTLLSIPYGPLSMSTTSTRSFRLTTPSTDPRGSSPGIDRRARGNRGGKLLQGRALAVDGLATSRDDEEILPLR